MNDELKYRYPRAWLHCEFEPALKFQPRGGGRAFIIRMRVRHSRQENLSLLHFKPNVYFCGYYWNSPCLLRTFTTVYAMCVHMGDVRIFEYVKCIVL